MKRPLFSHIGLSSLIHLLRCTVALSSTTKVSLWMRKEKSSRKLTILSALLAMEGKCVSQDEGIVDDDVDKSIHNLTSIGAEAMCKTDDMVLSIMTSKKQKRL